MHEPYDPIAMFYDIEHEGFDDDVQWYLNMIENGPVLEIGSGTGRVMGALLERGLEVWGIEPSIAMMAAARARLQSFPRAHLVAASVPEIDLSRRFPAVIMPLNTLWHFSTLDAQIEALRFVHRHLDPDGLLLLDLTNPLSMADRGANGELRQRFVRSTERGLALGVSAAWDDETDHTLTLSLTYDRSSEGENLERAHTEFTLRYVLKPELELLLRCAHLEPLHIYGSYDLDPYSALSPNLLAVVTPGD